MCKEFDALVTHARALGVGNTLKRLQQKGHVYCVAELTKQPDMFVNIINNSRLRDLMITPYNGCYCVRCGVQGNTAIRVRYTLRGGVHHDVYAIGDEHVRLMTVDHVLPKSWGGLNFHTNFEPMCDKCNSHKGNTVTEEEVVRIITNIDDHLAPSEKALRKFLQLLTNWPYLRSGVVKQLYACQDGHIKSGLLHYLAHTIGNVRELFTDNYTSDEMLDRSIDMWT